MRAGGQGLSSADFGADAVDRGASAHARACAKTRDINGEVTPSEHELQRMLSGMRDVAVMIVQPSEGGNGPAEDSMRALDDMTCTRVCSARQAAEAAAEKCPDVALIDLSIGSEVQGIEAAELLGEEFGVPVLYLTDGNENVLRRAETAEPYGYVLKPVDPRQLRLSIHAVLSFREREIRHRQSVKTLRRRITELRRKTQSAARSAS